VAQVQGLDPQEKSSAGSVEHAVEGGPVAASEQTAGAARVQHAALRRLPTERVCVHYGGRQFICSYEMAGIFLRRAQRLIDAEDAELVPLVFEDGLELLYVSSAMPFSVHDVDTEPADGSHLSSGEPGALRAEAS
jgi:hypothetical protein